MWGGGIPFPTEVGSGEGLCPSPEHFEILYLEKPHFGAFLRTFELSVKKQTEIKSVFACHGILQSSNPLPEHDEIGRREAMLSTV